MITRAEWDALSERDQDAIVAEKVIGKQITAFCSAFACGRCDGDRRLVCGACGRYGHGNCYGDGTGALQVSCANVCEAPSFTTSWDAISQVVEKMHATGHELMAEWDAEDRLWFVNFTVYNATTTLSDKPFHATRSSTLPGAACIAALVVLGYMEPAP